MKIRVVTGVRSYRERSGEVYRSDFWRCQFREESEDDLIEQKREQGIRLRSISGRQVRWRELTSSTIVCTKC
jgi:hypothetical protein